MGKTSIKCVECDKNVLKWEYEINLIKDLKSYKCKQCKRKNSKIEKKCPVCEKTFKGNISQIKNKVTCSYACSNKHFRTGEKNGNWNPDSYRSTCFSYHKKECIICGENKIVAVHHYDENHTNNDPANLIPLCPTHHQYIHSKYKCEIIDKVNDYRKKLKLPNNNIK